MSLGPLLQFHQHLSKKLTGGQNHSRSDVVLVGLVFVAGGRTHLLQSVLALAVGKGDPGRGDLALDVHLVGPVLVVLLNKDVAMAAM